MNYACLNLKCNHMKYFKEIIFVLTILFSVSTHGASPKKMYIPEPEGFTINFNIKNIDDSLVYIARYFGDNKYIKDTIVVNGAEKFSYTGDENLPCGIYLLVREKRNAYFEFIVHDQNFTINTDTADFINKTTFENSPDNEKLYDYFKFAGKLGKEAAEIQERNKKATEENNLKEIDKNKSRIKEIGKAMIAYKKKFMAESPDNPMTVVFNLQQDIIIPDSLKSDTSTTGEKNKYYYYLNHYWEHTPFESTCILRTPIFHTKLQQYFDKYVPQHYDSAIVYIDPLIEKARVNPELFKYIVNYVTFKWESGEQKRMCWDKVFYHMATKYYRKGECTWTDSVKLAKIESRAKDLSYVLCGQQAINPHMKKYYPMPGLYDTTGYMHDLYKVKADIVIMWFWDSDCGHCKKQTPVLWEMYEKYKKQGKSIEVYAVNVEQESKGYKEYLKENKYSWINVQDTGNFSQFRKYYDIYSTPVSFILDKERKIIGKRLAPAAVDTFLEQYFKEEEQVEGLEK